MQWLATQVRGAQHGLVLQSCPMPTQEAASAAVGTSIEVTNGRVTIAAIPTLRITSRRDKSMLGGGNGIGSSSKPALLNLRKVIHTSPSSTGGFAFSMLRVISATVFLPSHNLQTSAAIWFRQCAWFVSLSYTMNSSLNCRTMVSFRFGAKCIAPFFIASVPSFSQHCTIHRPLLFNWASQPLQNGFHHFLCLATGAAENLGSADQLFHGGQ